jgi:sterol 24-C-methyltransferase
VQEKKRKIKVDSMIQGYNDLHKDEGDLTAEKRNNAYTTLVNSYYELATLFYEWGWGQSFHFAYQLKGESFKESIARHEYYLAGRLGLKKGDKVLDVGCGIGGPMRNIARFTRANITGVTLNEYQVIRGNELNAAAGLSDTAKSVQCDFMKLDKFEDNSFDGVYAIEATCHAPVRETVYGECHINIHVTAP